MYLKLNNKMATNDRVCSYRLYIDGNMLIHNLAYNALNNDNTKHSNPFIIRKVMKVLYFLIC